jgi:surfactin synthase thioesterase subunit
MEIEGTRSVWLLRPRPNPEARIRLFCFPYAGKGASLFRTWPQALPAWVDVCGVQYPGREHRLPEEPFTRMLNLAETAAYALRPYVDRPYVVFGHSFGALAGFEWVRQLRRLGCPEPATMVVAAHRAPHLAERRAPIAHLSQPEFITEMQSRYDGIPTEVLQSPELLDLLVPTLRADIRLLEGYAYLEEQPLGCPIACFGGRDDVEATREDLDAWRHHTTAGFSVRIFPGGHFFLQSAQVQVVNAVASIVLTILDQSAAGGRRP